jgi:hypothetical protein
MYSIKRLLDKEFHFIFYWDKVTSFSKEGNEKDYSHQLPFLLLLDIIATAITLHTSSGTFFSLYLWYISVSSHADGCYKLTRLQLSFRSQCSCSQGDCLLPLQFLHVFLSRRIFAEENRMPHLILLGDL